MDKNDYINKLRSSIELSIGQISNGTIECQIIQGLSFTKWDDKENIKFAFKTSFDIIPNASFPLTIELVEQISVTGSSITHIVENHPIYILQINQDSSTESYIWYNYGENPILNYSITEKSPTQIDSILEKILHPNFFAFVFACSLPIWYLIRRYNLNSTILDEMEFDDNKDDEIYEDTQHSQEIEELDTITDEVTISKPEPIMNYEDDLEYVESNYMVIQEEKNPNKRTAFTLDDDSKANEDTSIKRRSGKVQRNKQGPVMSTKRKRLDGKLDIPGQKIVSKKRAVKPKQRKVRRVKSEDDEW